MGEAADQGLAVQFLELVELRTVDQAGDDVVHVERLAPVGGDHAIDLLGRKQRLARLAHVQRRALRRLQRGDDAPGDADRMAVVLGIVIGDAGLPRMHVGAAEFFGRDHLAGRCLHQRRPAEKDRALIAHDDALVRHRRHIGAARRARTHHDGNLRDAQRRHLRLIVEDAAEVPFVGENLVLLRQEGAAGIDHVDAGQVVLARDILRPQVLFHRHRIVGAALDGRIIGDDHAFAPRDPPHPGDDARRMHIAAIEAVGGQRRKFEKRRSRIDQEIDALARQHLATRQVPRPSRLAAAARDLIELLAEFADQRAHDFAVGRKIGRGGVDRGMKRHGLRRFVRQFMVRRN